MNFIYVLGGWLFLLLGLAISIALHELGHLLPAKKFGVKVTKYMVGFGPTVFSRKRGETEYGIKLIPLGGYIQMVGMVPPLDKQVKQNFWRKLTNSVTQSEEPNPEDDARAFYRLAPWKKLIVMFGGPFANLLIATVLSLALFAGFGGYDRNNTVHQIVSCIPSDQNPDCTQVGEPSPASVAGLKAGDKIVSFAGHKISRWSDIDPLLAKYVGTPETLVVERQGAKLALTITVIKFTYGGQTRPFIGVYLESQRYQLTPVQALGNLGSMLSGTGEMILQLPAQAVKAIAEIAPGSTRNPNGAISIIGLGQYSGDLASSNTMSFEDKILSQLAMILSLNVALFVFNMLPLVPLDGGHIAGALYESVKRGIWRIRGKKLEKPVATALMMPIAYMVASLMFVLTIILVLRDVINPVHL
jgi:membrane-associated protease RseP (regulator of RpoE activity)